MRFLKFTEHKSFQDKFNFVRDCLVIFGGAIALIGLFFTFCTFHQTKEIASAQLVDKIMQRLDSSQYDSITTAIEGNGDDTQPQPSNYPIWKRYGGQFSYSDIAAYINNFDEIYNLYDRGLIDTKLAYMEFGYDAEKAYCNNNIKNLIISDRQTDPDKTYNYKTSWYGFEQLAISFLKIDNVPCSALDKE